MCCCGSWSVRVSWGPFGYVKKMRESRPPVVQTEGEGFPGRAGWQAELAEAQEAPSPRPALSPGQYVFLHQCILRFLQQSKATVRAQEGPPLRTC